VPHDFVGISAEDVFVGNPAYRDQNLQAQSAIGIGLIRQNFDWAAIETAPGQYDLTYYDEFVAAAASKGITILPILFHTPEFHLGRRDGTSACPPRDNASLAAYAQALVRRYGSNGTLWAERPDLPAETREKAIFWIGQSGGAENEAFLRSLYGKLKEESLRNKVLFSISQTGGPENGRWLLGVAQDTIAGELAKPGRYALLAEALSPVAAAKVDELALRGIYTQPTTQRLYPGRTTAANVIGTVHSDGTGAAGIESQFNSVLAGHDGSLTYSVDNVGNMETAKSATVKAKSLTIWGFTGSPARGRRGGLRPRPRGGRGRRRAGAGPAGRSWRRSSCRHS